MATLDKVILMNKVEDTLKPRMFANLLEEAVTEIQTHLDDFDVQYVANSDGKSDDMLQAFINAKQAEGRTSKTLTRYAYIIGRFMHYAGVKTREITTEHIRDYFASESKRGIADSTIEGYRQILNTYFGWLEHEKMIPINPAFNISAVKYEKKVREAFEDTDIERLKRSCRNKRDPAILCFLLSTGCRIGEATALNIKDVDLDNGECIVYGKGKKFRIVYLDDVTTMLMREYLATRNDTNEALFIGRGGKRFHDDGVRCMLKRLAKASGVGNVHPHRCRRTLITKLLNHGMPIQEVAIVAGHDKIETTMKYFSSSKERIKNSYKRYSE